MDATLKALAELFVQSIPTIVFFLFLTWFLNAVYFRPVARILEERRKATEGVRDLAQRAFDAANQKQSEFETALNLARQDIYKQNEEMRKQWAAEQASALEAARAQATREIDQAKSDIALEAERARNDLDGQIEKLSGDIVSALLRRRAA